MAEEDSEKRCPTSKSLINARDNPLSISLPYFFDLEVWFVVVGCEDDMSMPMPDGLMDGGGL